MALLDPLIDGHGRRISDLRVSVTDRCNFRCQYCMPADGLPWLDRADVLSFEEIERLVRLFVALGVEDLRLTGGEPLLRPGITDLVRDLKATGVPDLALTTNAQLLAGRAAELKNAGLSRVNISLDTLRPDRFQAMARAGEDAFTFRDINDTSKPPPVVGTSDGVIQ